MKTGLFFTRVIAALSVFTGCVEELAEQSETAVSGRAKVVFDVMSVEPLATRSSITASENIVENVNIYVYADGVLEEAFYVDGENTLSVELRTNAAYNIYAFANVGEVAPPYTEDGLHDLKYEIEGPDDFGNTFPMSWSQRGVSVLDNMQQVKVSLARLVSKIYFSMDRSGLDGLQIKSVRLCQCALDVSPFAVASSGIAGSAATRVGDCDYASEEDLSRLNAGEKVFFYALENCQGTLLPDNTDEWAKIPDSIGEKADMCTYLEVECEFDEGFMYGGNVTYRFYAGLDNVSNFDLMRNTEMDIRLLVTGAGMRELSWRVDADVNVMSGYAYGKITQGVHDETGLYVGELFEYEVTVAEELLEDYGGDISECSLGFVSDNMDDEIRFSDIFPCEDGKRGLAVGRCRECAEGEIWLYDNTGKRIVQLCDNVKVSLPSVKVSYSPATLPDGQVEDIDERLMCRINGEDRYFYLYLVDSEGYNLLSSRTYGYDLSLFDFSAAVEYTEYGIDECVQLDTEMSGGGKNEYAARVACRIVNDGYDYDINCNLVSSMFSWDAADIGFQDSSYGLYAEGQLDVWYLPVTLTVVDNGWAKYHDCQLSLIVDNPSNIPLYIVPHELFRTDGNYRVQSYQKDFTYNNAKLKADYIPYLASSYFAGLPDLYGTGSVGLEIISQRDEAGDIYLSKGNLMIYPLDGIYTSHIHSGVKNDGGETVSLHHLFDVTSCGHSLAYVDIVDNLSDGSMKYDIIYGDDPEYGGGWNNCGMWLYSDNGLLYKPNHNSSRPWNMLDEYRDLTPVNLREMEIQNNMGPMEVQISYENGYLYASVRNNRKGVAVDVSISGTVSGEVTTHPNGTWGAAKHNYCSKDFSGEKRGITLSGTKVRIDNGALKSAIDGVYATTFFDSKNWMGSANNYQHSAHPTQITLDMKIRTTGDFRGMYPVRVSFSNTSVNYYHAQDNTTYTVAYRPSCTLPLYVRVKEK